MRRDARYATPRTRPPREIPVGWISAIICITILGGLAAIVWLLVRQINDAAYAGPTTVTRQAHDSLSPTYTHDGEIIRWYVLVDPDTGVQYLVNDRGGCCPRLDAEGVPMGVKQEERGL